MRVPVAWLREYCDPGTSAEEIADALTMAGLKVERLHRVGVGDPAEFVVGKVLSAERHPDADRLTVCTRRHRRRRPEHDRVRRAERGRRARSSRWRAPAR